MNRYQLLIVLFVAVLVLIIVRVANASVPAATRAAVCDVFGPRCAAALAVAGCETGWTWNPHAYNPRSGTRGLFQIHPVHFQWLDEDRLWEPTYNARIAYRLSRGGRDWRAWTCKP